MISVIIPSRNELYLNKTIEDLLNKSTEKIEVIVILDGYWADEIIEDERVHYIHYTKSKGMRRAINDGVAISKGEYILKTDAHCMFEQGFDLQLSADCEDDWVMIPRRVRLDPEKWEVINDGRPPIDYMYLAYPDDPSVWGGSSLQGKEWKERNVNEKVFWHGNEGNAFIDAMTAQGSFWFMKRSYYDFLELMDEENYGEFGKEMQEIGLKCWLSGGRMVRTRKTFYAHWHKPRSYGRGYSLSKGEFQKASDFTKRWFEMKEGEPKVWHKQTKDLKWLINKFWPVPGWPEEWCYDYAKK